MPTGRNPATGQSYAIEPWMLSEGVQAPWVDPIDMLAAVMTAGGAPALEGLVGLGERGAIGSARPVAEAALKELGQVAGEKPVYVPALRLGGKIWKGSVGDTHGDLAARKGILDVPDLVSGWVDTLSGEWTTKAPKLR